MKNNKKLISGTIGIILIITAIDQIIAEITKIHYAINSWVSFIILILGIYFLERTIKNRIKK